LHSEKIEILNSSCNNKQLKIKPLNNSNGCRSNFSEKDEGDEKHFFTCDLWIGVYSESENIPSVQHDDARVFSGGISPLSSDIENSISNVIVSGQGLVVSAHPIEGDVLTAEIIF
jgi:hypothetical protein